MQNKHGLFCAGCGNNKKPGECRNCVPGTPQKLFPKNWSPARCAEGCHNWQHFQGNLNNPEKEQCEKCTVKENGKPTQWQQKPAAVVSEYTPDHVNFPALRSALRAKMERDEISEGKFRIQFGKAYNTVLKWIIARKINPDNFDHLCAWIGGNKTMFVAKTFKIRMPYYTKADKYRQAAVKGK